MRQFAKKIHMVGIGGAGMSPLAEVLHAHGHTISGSDRMRSATTARLESLGIAVQYDHTPSLVARADLLVYSSAVKPENEERMFAAGHDIPCMRRAEVLGDLMRAHFTICIAGTHGKTTTTSMVGTLFHESGRQPTVLVGGMLRGIDSHAVIGKGGPLIAEADEFDRSFLSMYPTLAIITNVEADHLDCYRDLNDIKDAFVAFTDRVPFYGAVIACADDAGVQSILGRIQKKVITYGIDTRADYRAEGITFTKGMPSFTVVGNGVSMGGVTLSVPGMHNVLNALAAIAAATEMGVEWEGVQKSIGAFEGVRRRFEVVANVNNITVVDDYAHHPGEIKATLEAARRGGFARIIAVFQPHLYTRTRDFLEQFAQSLCTADQVIVMPIYKSREEPIPGVNSEAIAGKIRAAGNQAVFHASGGDAVVNFLKTHASSGDAVIFMGAGDIGETAARFAKELSHG